LNAERGSVSLVLVAAMGFSMILASFVVDLARASGARVRAQAAADAAALAAAQEQVVPSGREPGSAAAEYAERNGARLVICRCPEHGSEAIVVVEADVVLPALGIVRTVRAMARAVVESPAGSMEDAG
jgi:secretion/DNA translocation related TadE-like protein